DRRQQLVEFHGDHASRCGERQGIACERARRAAEHVARKLVEGHDEGERCERGRLPPPELASRRPFPGREKAAADFRVERFRFPEPRFARPTALTRIRRAEPEIEHLDEIRCAHGTPCGPGIASVTPAGVSYRGGSWRGRSASRG